MEVDRRLVAVFAADVEGYSRLMGADEVGTLKRLTERRAILDKAIADHRGRIANTAGDSVLAEFGSAVDAVQCAVEAQAALAEANSTLPIDKRINFRIGIHVGDVMVRAGDLFGDGVNIAARLQTLAQPGGVCVSGVTYDHVRKVVPVAFTDLGPQQVKNIEEPVRAYAVAKSGDATAAQQLVADVSKPLPLPDKPSIAVLPFQNMSGDPEQEYFADGMVEDIITALSRFKSLFVIARNSSFTYKGKAVDIKQAGRELGVRYVLEGSVRRAGGRLRITAQLIEAVSNHHVWADKFDGVAADIFDFQDRIAEQVVGAIAPAVEAAEIERAKAKRVDNLSAYELLLRAKACLDQAIYTANQEGLALVYKAIEVAPDYADAYALGAELYVQRNTRSMPFDRDKEIPEAVRLAKRAVSLSRDDPEVLTSAGLTLGNLLADGSAIAMLDRAIELNPNLARAWSWRGAGSLFESEPERAIEYAQRALRLTPLDPQRYITLSTISLGFVQLERYDEAYEWAEKAYSVRENATTARCLIVSATLSGRHERSREVLQKLLIEYPDITVQRLSQGLSGWRGEKEKRRIHDALRVAGVPE